MKRVSLTCAVVCVWLCVWLRVWLCVWLCVCVLRPMRRLQDRRGAAHTSVRCLLSGQRWLWLPSTKSLSACAPTSMHGPLVGLCAEATPWMGRCVLVCVAVLRRYLCVMNFGLRIQKQCCHYSDSQ